MIKQKMWMYLTAAILYIAAIVLFFCTNQEENNKNWVFFGTLLLSAMTVFGWEEESKKRKVVALSTGIFLVILVGMWLLPISPVWTVIPIFFIGEIILLVMDVADNKMYMFPLIIALTCAWAMM